jgi:iron-sulfur cluster repair protein YtfE (RIC family)
MGDEHRLTDPLRIEHRRLVPKVDDLRLAAAGLRDRNVDAALARVDKALSFLHDELLPHARAEEDGLYPAVEKALGSPRVTETMRRDHVEIGRMSDALRYLRAHLADAPRSETVEALRRLLYGLHAVVMLHFAKEEEIYLPVLDQNLTRDDLEHVVGAMREAASATNGTPTR